MDVKWLSKNLRRMIAKGNINSTIENLIEILEGTSLYDDAIQQSARFESLKKKERNGIATNKELDIERNEITGSLLSLIEKLEEEYEEEDKVRNAGSIVLINKEDLLIRRKQNRREIDQSKVEKYSDTGNDSNKTDHPQENDNLQKVKERSTWRFQNFIIYGITAFLLGSIVLGGIFRKPKALAKNGSLVVSVLDSLRNPLDHIEVEWRLNNIPRIKTTDIKGEVELSFKYKEAEVGQELTLLIVDPSGKYKNEQVLLVTMQGNTTEEIVLEQRKRENIESVFVNFTDSLNYLIQEKLVILSRIGTTEKRYTLKNGAILLEYPAELVKEEGIISLFLEKNDYYRSPSNIFINTNNVEGSIIVELVELSDPDKEVSKFLTEKIISDTNRSQTISTRIYDKYQRRLNFSDGLKVDIYVNNLNLNTKQGDFRVVAFYGIEKPKLVLNERGYKIGEKPFNFTYEGRIISFSVVKIARKFKIYKKIAHLNVTNYGILD